MCKNSYRQPVSEPLFKNMRYLQQKLDEFLNFLIHKTISKPVLFQTVCWSILLLLCLGLLNVRLDNNATELLGAAVDPIYEEKIIHRKRFGE